MSVTLKPRTYFLVDRVAKLLGILGIVAALAGFSPLFGLLGLAIGVSTIFVETE